MTTDFKVSCAEIALRMIESVQAADPKLSQPALLQLALTMELARLELRMRALAGAVYVPGDHARKILEAIVTGKELP